MNTVDNYFLSLPLETLTEILHKLPVSNILRYCQTYSTVSNICYDENFWWQYINKNWPDNYLQTVLSFDLNDVFMENIKTILYQRIGDPHDVESITNWPLAIAVFLENSKLISLSHIENNFIIVFEKNILISKYDKLVTFLDAYPNGYSSLISAKDNFYINEVTKGNLNIFRTHNDKTKLFPILKLYGDMYNYQQDYADVQIKDIFVDNKPLFDVITELEISKNDYRHRQKICG
jgi:hypothetical protein